MSRLDILELKVDEKFKLLELKVGKQFCEVEVRVTALEGIVDNHEQRLSDLEAKKTNNGGVGRVSPSSTMAQLLTNVDDDQMPSWLLSAEAILEKTRAPPTTSRAPLLLCVSGAISRNMMFLVAKLCSTGRYQFCGELLDTTGILVCQTALCAKARVAVAHNVPVVTTEWLVAAENSELPPSVDTHKLQPLGGAIVCFSGVAFELREIMARLVCELGGAVSPALTPGVTHLVAERFEGPKVDACVTDRAYAAVQLVKPAWLKATEREQMASDPLLHAWVPTAQRFVAPEVAAEPAPLTAATGGDVADAPKAAGPALPAATTGAPAAGESATDAPKAAEPAAEPAATTGAPAAANVGEEVPVDSASGSPPCISGSAPDAGSAMLSPVPRPARPAATPCSNPALSSPRQKGSPPEVLSPSQAKSKLLSHVVQQQCEEAKRRVASDVKAAAEKAAEKAAVEAAVEEELGAKDKQMEEMQAHMQRREAAVEEKLGANDARMQRMQAQMDAKDAKTMQLLKAAGVLLLSYVVYGLTIGGTA